MDDTLVQKFLLLVLDPYAAEDSRASAWTFSVDVAGTAKEGRLQANLCALIPACGVRNSMSLTVSGPADDESHFTELSKIGGLVGTPRLAANYTFQLTNANGFAAGVSGVVGKPRFAFLALPGLTPDTVDKTVYSFGVEGGWKVVDKSFHLSYRYQQAWKAKPKQTLCRPAPFGPPGTQSCGDQIVGEPVGDINSIAAMEARFVIGTFSRMAVRIAHDLRSGTTGIDLPIYIDARPKDSKDGLEQTKVGGGVRPMYRSHPSTFALGFFLGTFRF